MSGFRKRLCLLGAAGMWFGGLTSPPVVAAEAFEGSIPTDTVEVLLGLGDDPEARIYRDVAEDFPLQDLPEGFDVLGSVVQSGGIALHLRSNDTGTEPVDRLTHTLENAGWQLLRFSISPEGGFLDPRGFRSPGMFCRDQSGTLQFNSVPRGQFQIFSLRWSEERAGAGMTCREMLNMSSGIPQPTVPLQDHMPDLVLPREADLGGRRPGSTGSFSGGRGTYESSTFLDIDWESGRLNAHFATQLEAQGWSLEEDWAGAAIGGSLWRRSVGELELQGLLTLLQRREGEYRLEFQLLDAESGR